MRALSPKWSKLLGNFSVLLGYLASLGCLVSLGYLISLRFLGQAEKKPFKSQIFLHQSQSQKANWFYRTIVIIGYRVVSHKMTYKLLKIIFWAEVRYQKSDKDILGYKVFNKGSPAKRIIVRLS